MAKSDKKVETILDEVLQIKGDWERKAYLDRACEGDTILRQRVADLLEAHRQAGDFFDASALGLSGETSLAEVPLREGPGSAIGPHDGLKAGRYKLLVKIGEGGMGVVYMAEQTEPVSRKVALKIIKLGMDTKQVVARFEAECQALALMEHPHIARVLDGGATETAADITNQYLRFGSSPRRAQTLILAAKVRALTEGRFNVSFDDIPTCSTF